MPGTAGHMFASDLTHVHSITETAAGAYGLTAAQALELGGKHWLPEFVKDAYTDLVNRPEWKAGEVAGFDSIVKRGDGRLWRSMGLIIPQSRLVKWQAEPCLASQRDKGQMFELITFDELGEAA